MSSLLPAWDLSDLYSGPDDPALLYAPAELLERARAFEKAYRGRIGTADCTASLLVAALTEYDAISRLQARPLGYAGLRFSQDTSDPARGALFQRMQVQNTAIANHLVFFELEIGRMPADTFQALITDPALAPYGHYLEHERELAAHRLSEPEEKIIQELNNTGVHAFNRLFSEVTSRAVFRVTERGETRELNQSQTLALLFDRNRETRRAASAAITDVLKEHAHVLTFIFNTLLQEKMTSDRLRRYEYPEQARHQSNELTPEVVQHVVDVCVGNYDVVADYYRLKGELLGLKDLSHYDRYAPVGDTVSEIDFAEARRLVLESIGEFSPSLQSLTEPFFTRGWIDAELRPGKQGGAYCSYLSPDLHPYVFVNYTRRARDVMTLAHELGHALHGVLASGQNYLSFYPSLPLAETASVFGEMLVFEKLQNELQDPREKLTLLCGKIEDSFSTVFRQVSMFRFEQAAHAAYRAEGELPTERYNAIWQSTMQEMFGDALALGEEHGWWWLYIPHVFSTPFYVYAYSFGELLVTALYARYRQEGAPFVERYTKLLAAGGSRRPTDLLQELGIDITRKEFWQSGIDLIRDMVHQAKELARATGATAR